MPKIQLARSESVSLKSIWRDEAKDLTPWLRDNLHLLGEVLGSDLRFAVQEFAIGGFRVDLVAELDGRYWTVIENQLGKSDHNHLGQSLTYASGIDAHTLIWIAEDFDRQHLLAIDRLNRGMKGDLEAYAVRLEAFRVGGSGPVVRFHVVAHPSGWFPPGADVEDPRILRGRGFFERLAMESGDETMGVGSNSHRSFLAGADSAADDPDISYTLAFRGKENTKGTSVHLWIQTDSRTRNVKTFEHLRGNKDEIEQEVGRNLLWELSPPGGHACAIRWRDPQGSIDDSPLELAQARVDLLARYEKLRGALDKRLPAAVAAARR